MSDYFLADDLSGALDAAGAFHAAGRHVRIVWTLDAWNAAPADAVVGFTTETRNATAAAAAATVTRTLRHAKGRNGRLRYKKIDSTLRGPVAAELGAVLAALPQTRVLFSPANPSVGRTVRDGMLLVNGVPVAETEFGRDPASPVRTNSIRAMLGLAAADRVVIADAATGFDLEAAVGRMQRAGAAWVAVGSGALARPVAALHHGRGPSRPAVMPLPPVPGARLMIGGSAHPANREQAGRLARECAVPVCAVMVSRPADAVGAAVRAVRESGGAILILEPARTTSERALQAITAVALETIAATAVARVFVTGGETAFALCTKLGMSFLDFAAELELGLSVSVGEAAGQKWVLAIKPGGFGDPRTWVRAWRALGAA